MKELFKEQANAKNAQPQERTSFFRRFIGVDPEASCDSTTHQEQSAAVEPSPSKPSFFRQFLPQLQDSTSNSPLPTPKKSKTSEYFQRHESAADTMLCEECGSRVLIHLMPEHTDFHFARKLQQEWNQEVRQEAVQNQPSTSRPPTKTPTQKPSQTGKRGRKRGVAASSNSSKACPTIDRFFTKNT